MRLHSDTLTTKDLYKAVADGPVWFATLTEHKSRTHERAFEVKLAGSGTHSNSGYYGADTRIPAATWDEWGIFLSRLYDIDLDMVVGTVKRPVYADCASFDLSTNDRFSNGQLTWADQHAPRHTWRSAGVRVQECRCGAVRRL